MSYLLLLAVGALVGAQVYRLLWHHRYLHPPGPTSGIFRLQGRVCGPGEPGQRLWPPDRDGSASARWVEIEGVAGVGPQAVRIDADAPLVGLQRVCVGGRVTVDAVSTSVRADETLYRDHGMVETLDAIRVMGGAWPRLGWLGPLTGGVLVLAIGLTLFGQSGNRTWLVRKTAAKTVCPLGTAREAIAGPQLLQRCVDRQGRLHGSYTLWDWSGRLRERASYTRGQLDGVRDVLMSDGSMLRTTYRHGLLHGPSILLSASWQPRRQTSYHLGDKHGVERLWHDNGKRALVAYYYHGMPLGEWALSSRSGRKLAEASMSLAGERWTFWDAHGLGSCGGDREVATAWLASQDRRERCAIRCQLLDPLGTRRAVCLPPPGLAGSPLAAR